MTNTDQKVGQEFLALTQVLEAETAAQIQLETARKQAEKVIQDAQKTAREIAARTDKRIQALHSGFQASIGRKKSKFEREFLHEKSFGRARIGKGEVLAVTNKLARQVVGVTRK